MELIGQIHLLKEEQKITETFSKKELILKTVEQYAQHYPIEFHNANINMLDGYQDGDVVRIMVNLRGNLSKAEGEPDRAFTTIAGWKITRA